MPGTTSEPSWETIPPARFDLVSVYFPEHAAPEKPGLKLRPGLVVSVHQGRKSGAFAARIAFGTKNLKIASRSQLDLIIQNSADLTGLGIYLPTRFDLDHILLLPWTTEFFGCWSGKQTPALGALTAPYIRDFAYLMMRRG